MKKIISLFLGSLAAITLSISDAITSEKEVRETYY